MQHIVALSFEHRNGNQIDKIYPPFPETSDCSEWEKILPFIAIPDKAHGACSSVIQFTLPDTDNVNGIRFGLAAYRSIETSELQKTNPAYIRDHVQRSLCVISSVPLFGELEKPLKQALYDNFDSLTDNLETIYNDLSSKCASPVPFSGISYASFFQSCRMNILPLVRALFLQRKILIFADNSELCSKMCVALASLLPDFLYPDSNSPNTFPIKFLEGGEHKFAFAPYVPLLLTETLNNHGAQSALMGTCSELFLENNSSCVKYDILVDCRTLPATITFGNISKIVELSKNESEWMNNVLKYMTQHWAEESSGQWVRNEFRKWANSMLVSILRVRHLKEVPKFTRMYLDWEKTEVFGDTFMKLIRKRDEIDDIIQNKSVEDIGEFDENLLVLKKSFMKLPWK